MLDKVIIAHLDEMDAIEQEVSDGIDRVLKMIDIDLVLKDPKMAMGEIAEAVGFMMQNRFSRDCLDKGVAIAEKIEKMERDLKIPDSEDPNLNKDVA